MKLRLLSVSIALLSSYNNYTFSADREAPPLQLAKSFQSDIDISKYWVSEKVDGIRAYWSGKKLITRKGNIIQAPNWFTAPLPKIPLDGELWINRKEFELVSGIVRQKVPDDNKWRKVKYMLFDLPGSLQTFSHRKVQLAELVKRSAIPHLQLVEQNRVNTELELHQLLKKTVAKNGEGLMLRHENSVYQAKRSNDLLKLKIYQDAEAKVIAHFPGRGKNKGLMGSILVETKQGIKFKIGTGFSNQERQSPPVIGSTITYRFRGKTNKGTPRFASFMRMRDEF